MVKMVRFITCICIIALLTVPVFAEEKTQAELLQEMMMNGETGDNSEALTEPNFDPIDDPNIDVPDPEPADPVEPVDEPIDPNATVTIIELVNRIGELDLRNPDTKEVDTLMDMYNSLSDTNKISVTNYDRLEEAKKVVDAINPVPTEVIEPTPKADVISDDPDVKSEATDYLITIKGPVTVISRFTIDNNNDGKIDIPTYTILGPGGYTYLVDSTKLELKDAGISMYCTWVDRDYVQFDISEAVEGQWQFSSSLQCTYEKKPYIGPIPTPQPIISQQQAEEPTPMPGPSYSNALLIGIVIFVGILLMVGIILVMNKVDILQRITNPIKDMIGTGTKSKGKYKNEEDDYGASLTDEQIMAQIKKEYEEQKAKEEKMQEEARQEQVQEKYEKENEMNDDHMYETRFDYDDEEEELDEEELNENENEGSGTKKTRSPRFN